MGQLLDNITDGKGTRPCALGSALDDPTYGPDLAAALELHKTNPKVTFVVISQELAKVGLDVSVSLFSKHTRGLCRCDNG